MVNNCNCNCNRFESCNAPLCPLDPDIDKRVWYSDEDICKSQEHNKHRWIKKQRSIVKKQTKSYLNRPVTYQQLYDASRPMELSNREREMRRQRMLQMVK